MSKEPVKVAAFLRPQGQTSNNCFVLTANNSISIDASNFCDLSQGNPYIIFNFDFIDFNGIGYMKQGDLLENNSDTYPILYYPIQTEKSGSCNVYLRVYSSSSEFIFKIFLNDLEIEEVLVTDALIDQWIWVNCSIVLPDTNATKIGIQMCSYNIAIDSVFLSHLNNTPHANYEPFYCTAHVMLSELDQSNTPIGFLPAYDYKTTLNDILHDDWYMFSSLPLPGKSSLSITGPYGVVIFVSGFSNEHYIIWDFADNVDAVEDPYFSNCYLKYDIVSSEWTSDCQRPLALQIFSFRDALDSTGCLLVSSPADLDTKIIEDFDNAENKPYFINTKVVDISNTTNKVELDLPDRVVNFLIDQSGSLTWNDSSGLRHEICRRMIDRINSSYPGDLRYNVFTVGGTPISLNFFGVVENDDINTNNPSEVASAFFADQESGFAGIRILRKLGSSPNSPLDGDVVSEGFIEKAFDDNLIENANYFYKAYTFDSNNRFSNGVDIQCTPRSKIIPMGVGGFSYNILLGSGINKDINTKAIWHLSEKTGNRIYDFTSSQVHLSSTNDSPIWLNQSEVPIGYSGLRFNGLDECLEGVDVNGNLLSDSMTIMGWVFPFESSGFEVLFSYGDLASDGVYVGRIGSQIAITYNHIDYVFSSSILDQNNWNHLSVIINFSASLIKIYINGSLAFNDTFSLPTNISGNKIAIGKSIYSNANYFFGKITEFSIHNIERTSSYILNASTYPVINNPDNGDRLILLKYSIPSNFDFIGGSIRIVQKTNTGFAYKEIVSYTDEGDPIEILKYGSLPSHENDGDIIYETAPSVGGFVVSVPQDYVLDHEYFFRIFSQNAIGNFCSITDSPFLEIKIPKLDKREEVIGGPSDSLAVISNLHSVAGDRKNYLTWSLLGDTSDVTNIKIWYSETSFPVVEKGNSNGLLVFIGDKDSSNFVHRQLKNNVIAYYTIVATDRFGYNSSPSYIQSIPEEGLDEINIPLLEITKLTYEIVDEQSLSLSWKNPVQFERDIESWFDQRVVFFAKVTDNFGASINDLSNIELQATSVSINSADQAEDVFGEVVVRDEVTPDVNSLYILSYSKLDDGYIKGVLRLSADVSVLSSIRSMNFEIAVTFKVPDRDNVGSNVFEFYSKPISVVMKNPWNMEMINKNNDRIEHLCKENVPLFDLEFLTTLSFNPDKYKNFDGIYIRRSKPFVARVIVTYRGQPLPAGNKCFVAVHDASDPQCDEENGEKWQPSFSDNRSEVIVPQSSVINFFDTVIETPSGEKTVTVADIFLNSPRFPQGVMLFAKASYNGFSARQKMYVVFENTLRVDVTINEPVPDCIDKTEQFASCYLIDPDNPDKKISIPNSEIVSWKLSKGLTGKDRPFYSVDNIPNGPGIFSYVRHGTARNVFFGPACNVTPYIMTHPQLGVVVLPEIYAVKASMVYDGLSAFEELPLLVWPTSFSSVFGSRFLMEMPYVINDVWADGYDYEPIIISHDPNSSSTKFSSCFRSCAIKYGSDIFALDIGQIVNLYAGEMEITWGDDVNIEFDSSINEYLILGGKTKISQAEIDISSNNDSTTVYVKLNKFIGPKKDETNADGNIDIPRINPCECLDLNPLDKELPDDVIITADTLLKISGEERTLRAGGGLENGIPPVLVRLKEPLSIKFVGYRINGIPINKFIIDGYTKHEFVVEVSFSGKPVPDGTPVEISIGGLNPDIIVTSSITYTSQENDIFINPDGPKRSFARFEIAPLSPSSSFSAQIQCITKYDKRGDIDRKMSCCVTITYDISQSNTDTDDVEKTINSIFSNKLDRYDSVNNEWIRLGDMSYPRGGLTCIWTADEYGEKLWAMGGIDGNSILAYNEVYDIVNDIWEDAAALSVPRFYHMSNYYNGYIYVFGGFTVVDDKIAVTRSAERFDPATNSWMSLSPMPVFGLSDQDIYGVAMGSAVLVGDKFYIIGGVRRVDNKGRVESMNDRVLVYDILNDSWEYSDIYADDALSLYARVTPVAFIDERDSVAYIRILSGSRENKSGSNVELEFLTSTASINVENFDISSDDNKYSILPKPRYRTSMSVLEGDIYIIGGADGISQSIRTVDILDGNVSLLSTFTYSSGSSLNIGRSSAGLSNDGFRYLYLAGGTESGRPAGFLQIDAKTTPSSARLDGRQSVGVDIRLIDDNGNVPSSVRVSVRGYVIFSGSQQEHSGGGSDESQQSSGDINRNDLVYPVIFSQNDFVVENGFGSTVLMPRSDDILKNIKTIKEQLGINETLIGEENQNESLIINENQVRNPYKIKVQITIIDDFYYGETVVDISDNIDTEVDDDPYDPSTGDADDEGLPEITEDFADCLSIETSQVFDGSGDGSVDNGTNNGINISGLISASSFFVLTPSKMPQLPSPEVSYFSDISWVPQVIKILDGNDGSYEDAIKALNKVSAQIPFGGSPLFDGIVYLGQSLADESANDFSKVIYVHTDNEENLSRNTVDQTIDEIQSVDGFGKLPIVLNNYSIVFPITISALANRTDTSSLEKLANQTGGQSQTILDEVYVNDAIENSIGRMIGSIGYGMFEYTIDLEETVIINKISVDYLLYTNTDGNWKISVSSDGFNYSEYSDQFPANTEVNFPELNGRYIRFRSVLISGMSAASNEYNDSSMHESPAVLAFNITYSIPKVSYLFMSDRKMLYSPQQVSVSVNANRPLLSNIEVGVSQSRSINWHDYQSGSKQSVDQYGKIFIPIRSGESEIVSTESLENIDGFAFKAKYGRWDPKSTIIIKDNDGKVIDKSDYKLYPRKGLVVFKNKQSDNISIDIEDSGNLQLGIKITNRSSDDSVKISGVGYMYNTNVFLPPPLSKIAPSVSGLQILPSSLYIYSKISCHYKYTDINRDPEDVEGTIIRWFINGVEKEYLRNLRSWNDINDDSDPLWVYGLMFNKSDIPSGLTAEEYARQTGKSLLKVDDVVHFSVIPFDGQNYGDEIRSSSIRIFESPPFINSLMIKGERADGQIVDIITTATNAKAIYNFFADNPNNRSTITWYVNGVEFKRGLVGENLDGFENDTLLIGESRNSVTAIQIANVLEVEIIPSTSIEIGDAVRSSTQTVENQPPSAVDVRILPENPVVGSNLTLTYSFIDVDVESNNTLQSNQSSIRWYKSDGGGLDFVEVASLKDKSIVPASLLLQNDRWKAKIIPFDGVSVGDAVESDTVTISL